MEHSDISIFGFSFVAAITSLLLAENGVEHSYYIKKKYIPPLQLPPLSNPLINGPARQIENKYLEQFFEKATKSTLFKKQLISAFDDISLYFPWLMDETDKRGLIQEHCNG